MVISSSGKAAVGGFVSLALSPIIYYAARQTLRFSVSAATVTSATLPITLLLVAVKQSSQRGREHWEGSDTGVNQQPDSAPTSSQCPASASLASTLPLQKKGDHAPDPVLRSDEQASADRQLLNLQGSKIDPDTVQPELPVELTLLAEAVGPLPTDVASRGAVKQQAGLPVRTAARQSPVATKQQTIPTGRTVPEVDREELLREVTALTSVAELRTGNWELHKRQGVLNPEQPKVAELVRLYFSEPPYWNRPYQDLAGVISVSLYFLLEKTNIAQRCLEASRDKVVVEARKIHGAEVARIEQEFRLKFAQVRPLNLDMAAEQEGKAKGSYEEAKSTWESWTRQLADFDGEIEKAQKALAEAMRLSDFSKIQEARNALGDAESHKGRNQYAVKDQLAKAEKAFNRAKVEWLDAKERHTFIAASFEKAKEPFIGSYNERMALADSKLEQVNKSAEEVYQAEIQKLQKSFLSQLDKLFDTSG